MSNILEVKDLNVSYGGIKAVKNISFQVPKGEVVTLIGGKELYSPFYRGSGETGLRKHSP